MPRIELNIDEPTLTILADKARAAGQSRKKYLETLCTRDAALPTVPIAYPDPITIPNPDPTTKPPPGKYFKHGNGYLFEYQGQILYVSDVIFSLDNFQYYFTGLAGSVEDAILL